MKIALFTVAANALCFLGGIAVGAIGLLTLFAYDAIRLPWLHFIR